jgi:hypothetical protein
MTENNREKWEETPDCIITAGTNYWMSHEERYEFVKTRKYYKDKAKTIEVNTI